MSQTRNESLANAAYAKEKSTTQEVLVPRKQESDTKVTK